jgi:hypothetical protein
MSYRELLDIISKVEIRSKVWTTTDIRPEAVDAKVYSDHYSYVIMRDSIAIRVWGFDDPAGKRLFRNDYKEHVLG